MAVGQDVQQQMIRIGKELVVRGLITGTSGNISVRCEEKGFFYITPSGMPFEGLEPGDIVKVNYETGERIGSRRPSIEVGLHGAILRKRPEVNAVIHTHSLYATAVASTRKPIPVIIDIMSLALLGAVPVADYARPGTPELAKNVAEALGDRTAVLLANHGVVAVGTTLDEALFRCETVERAALTWLMASLIGGATPLDEETVRASIADYEAGYGQKPMGSTSRS